MTTLLRVKRKREEDAPSLIVVGQKRRKLEGDGTTETVFRLVTTLDEEMPVTSILKSSIRNILKRKISSDKQSEPRKAGCSLPKKAGVSLPKIPRSQIPLEDLEFATTDLEEADDKSGLEWKVVSQPTEKGKDCDDNMDKTVDNEPVVVLCNNEEMVREKLDKSNTKHVYDVYCVETKNSHQFNPLDLLYANREPEMIDDEEEEEDEDREYDHDDENDEDNWRNDYPEEESESDDDEDKNDFHDFMNECSYEDSADEDILRMIDGGLSALNFSSDPYSAYGDEEANDKSDEDVDHLL